MLGLPSGIVQVVPYQPDWASLFHDESQRLTSVLGALAFDIQHIGSTSVLGLAAKPILDIGIAVETEADISACLPLLTGIGYRYGGDRGSSEGHFFDRGLEQQLTHYLHMLLFSNPSWQNYLRFRDYLTAHPAVREAYMHLKQELAIQYPTNRAAYTAGKAQFIQEVIAAAQ